MAEEGGRRAAVLKSGGDGELQRAAVAAESGYGGGDSESERDGRALLVTVQAAVQDREVHVQVHAAATWTS